jgi:predicted metalloprotease
MKWQGRRQSTNIEDRRKSGSSRAGAATGVGGVGLIIVLFLGYILGVDVSPVLEGVESGSYQTSGDVTLSAADEEVAAMVAVVLADTEEVWTEIFRTEFNQIYTPPVLVLFKGATQSACGGANAATGPFYCPPEQKIFLDTDFFITLERQLGAGGDFAAAYVVAHEVAHHVQNELGILDQANRQRARVSEVRSNAISVQIELQADCLSGVWANVAQQRFDILQKGDIAEAMNAAERIGDDTLQREAGQTVRPDSFTHGTSEQRQTWFMRGFQSGDPTQCDTFTARTL